MTRIFRRALPLTTLLLSLSSFSWAQPSLHAEAWGKLDGKDVSLYTLRNSAGMEVKITNYGGTITYVSVPDRHKKFGDVVLGFDSLNGYTAKVNTGYFGATIGRYANRLGHGTFTLEGHVFHIPTNENGNTLHGGTKGFNKEVWDAKDVSTAHEAALELHRLSPDGEQGFPGNLNVTVKFTLTAKNELRLEYRAKTDQATVLNLTNHSYWNLSGPASGTILDDKLMIAADQYTPVDKGLIPTGAIDPVAGTPFDFRTLTTIGSRIKDNNQQLKIANGYDQNWVLSHPGLSSVAVKVVDPKSGRVMEVLTDQPGVQFYTGNFLDGTVHGVGGTYNFRTALALETQHFPDSPNRSNFPSTELKPGQEFHATTIYRFSTE
ncbi:MAG: galactose mutarotase [Acidobacteriota bacterium]|nr:galactose mutarotase [Acidobacteriota bacterium]